MPALRKFPLPTYLKQSDSAPDISTAMRHLSSFYTECHRLKPN